MRKTKIIATLGPATDDKEVVEGLANYANGFRFNFSHGDHKEHGRRLKLVKNVADEKNIALIADTGGPEIRTTNSENFIVEEGNVFDLYDVGVSHENLYKDVKEGDKILIDGGQLELVVKSVEEGSIKVLPLNSGTITSRRHINVPGRNISLPSLTEKDYKDLEFISNSGFDIVAQSFVRNAEDVIEVKKITGLHVIAKIENQQAINNLKEIIKVSDGVMVARGDLGVEIPIEKVPTVQRKIINETVNASKPVIVATHMMKSMVDSNVPSRAEAMDVASAVALGADCLMLSEETSIGKHPIKAIEVMDKIIKEAENNQRLLFDIKEGSDEEVITKNAVKIANGFNAPLIVPTLDGGSPKNVAKYRPNNTIYAITENKSTAKYMSLIYGVAPIIRDFQVDVKNFEEMLKSLNLSNAMFLFPYPRKVGGDINAMVYMNAPAGI